MELSMILWYQMLSILKIIKKRNTFGKKAKFHSKCTNFVLLIILKLIYILEYAILNMSVN